MEYNQFDQSAMVVESEPLGNRAMRRTYARNDIKAYFIFGASTVAIIVVGYGVWTVRQFIPVVGVVALLIALLLLLCLGAYGVVALLRYATRADYHDLGEFGTIAHSPLGKPQIYAPLSSAPMKVTRSVAKVEVTPIVPSLFDLIESGEISQGGMTMVMGYDKLQLEKGVLQLVTGPFPGTHAVAGKGRSGKTRRVIAMIAQALINGARVIICDPHHTKLDSLARSLEPLEQYLTIARGEEQIVTVSREFLGEMEARIDDRDRPCSPWLIVFDEWSRLMDENNAKMPEGGRDLLIDVAKNCSSQYAGYQGYCCLIGQFWTVEHAGGTDIRRSLQSSFIHQLSVEYAEFFIKGKWKNKAEELKRRECLYKDIENQVSIIVTVGVPDDTAQRVAVYLQSQGFSTLGEPASQGSLPAYAHGYLPGREGTYPALPSPQSTQENREHPNTIIASLPEMPPLVIERENTTSAHGSAPEVIDGSAPEAPRKRAEVQTEALRAIAKRLRSGESANEIRKSLGITGGRAMQEVNQALNMLGENTQGE